VKYSALEAQVIIDKASIAIDILQDEKDTLRQALIDVATPENLPKIEEALRYQSPLRRCM
jgi:hypothetical protein